MVTDEVATPGETCVFCGKPVAYIYKHTDLKIDVWCCPECHSIWGNAGSRDQVRRHRHSEEVLVACPVYAVTDESRMQVRTVE